MQELYRGTLVQGCRCSSGVQGLGVVQVYRYTGLVQVNRGTVVVQGYRDTAVIHDYNWYRKSRVV